jgi:hypothetical protein
MGYRNRRATGWLTVLLFGMAGCGGDRYPVSGRVLYKDGSPLTEGMVIGESSEGATKVMAQGAVQPDGSFRWGTVRPGDGARPGKYHVVVVGRALGEAETAKGMLPAVDPMFSNPTTSGIQFDVKETDNEFTVTVTRPRRSKQ